MADEKDVILQMYLEQRTQCRHHDQLRASVTNLVLLLGAAVLGLITYDDRLSHTDLYLSLLLVVLGFYGALCSAKHYERFRFHLERSKSYESRIERLAPDTDLRQCRAQAKENHCKRIQGSLLSAMYRVELWHIWLGLCLLLSVIGFSVTLLIL